MLEAMQYECNAFVTLTYDEEHSPNDGSVNTTDYRAWLKRLRDRVSPSRFRFVVVGEYGDRSERPHYHAALFGFRSCLYGQSRYSKTRDKCCYWCELVRDTWQKGNVYLGTLETSSAQYLAGYVTKKMTSKDDPRLLGRHPEFARMSLKPGIGHSALWEIADALMRIELDRAFPNDDVPAQLAHGKKLLPLGRYLRRNLRQMVGKDAKISQAAFDALSQELLGVRLAARDDKENPSARSHLIASMEGRLQNFNGRLRARNREKGGI